jgi:hypothetical protein
MEYAKNTPSGVREKYSAWRMYRNPPPNSISHRHMRHHHQQHAHTIAIHGSSTLGEHVLALLLEDEGYAARHLKAPPTAATTRLLPEGGSVEELLEGADVVLLWPDPTLRDEAREAFVVAMRSAAATAKIPVIALSPSMAVALKDELAGEAPFMRQFEQLMWIIKFALESPAGSIDFLDLAELAMSALPALRLDLTHTGRRPRSEYPLPLSSLAGLRKVRSALCRGSIGKE